MSVPRIVDLTQGIAGRFATLLLAELGWDVVKIDPPVEQRPTTGGTNLDAESTFLDRGKRRVTLDQSSKHGLGVLLQLIEKSQALIEDAGPRPHEAHALSVTTLRRRYPGIVVTSISNFGLKGPRSHWKANEFISQAMAGVVWGTGWADASPLKLPGFQANYLAGLNAASATIAAVYGISAGTATGCHIDVSIQETLALHWTRQVTRYAYAGRPYRRERRGVGRQGFPHTVPAADGYVYMLAMHAEWEELALFLGLDQFVTHEWSDPAVRARRWTEIEPAFLRAVASRPKHDWFVDAAEHGYTFAPVDGPADLLKSPQLAAREFIRGGQFPGLPFKPDLVAPRENVVSHPGEQNREVYLGVIGMSESDIRSLEESKVI